MAKFTGAGIDEPTKDRILRFLNFVNSASDIAGIEPQEGPVHDDPKKGTGDQIEDYDIGLTVAERIIDKRDGLPGGEFTDLPQLSDIDGFGQDKFNDLVYSFGSAFYGRWEHLGDAAVHVVHAAVLNSGKVLMFAGKSEGNNYPQMHPLVIIIIGVEYVSGLQRMAIRMLVATIDQKTTICQERMVAAEQVMRIGSRLSRCLDLKTIIFRIPYC